MNNRELIVNVSKEAMSQVLGVKADTLMDRVITPILNAGLEGLTYTEKMLQMIENHGILPNELAYLSIWGIEGILKEISNSVTLPEDARGCDDCGCNH